MSGDDPGLDAASADADVRGLLTRWERAFESRNEVEVRAVLRDDDRFVWLEDGQARYRSVDSIVAALGAFPDDLRFDYSVSDIGVVPLAPNAVWVRMSTRTEIFQSDATVSEFRGVVTMLVERDAEGVWRISSAHTSNLTRPGG